MTDATALTRYTSSYVAKKALFSFLGNAFRLYDQAGKLRFYVKQKAFKLKEEITVYADEGQSEPMLRIKARNILDTSATYDVTDAASGQVVGALRRKGLKSLFRDEWTVLDADETELGIIQEDSGMMAMVRRFLIKIIPQTFKVIIGGVEIGKIKQRFRLFGLTYDVDYGADTDSKLDPRLGVAAVVLLLAIEGKQK